MDSSRDSISQMSLSDRIRDLISHVESNYIVVASEAALTRRAREAEVAVFEGLDQLRQLIPNDTTKSQIETPL